MKPPMGEEELERLNALLEYHVLDTPPEDVYDSITKIASQICNAPICLISLVEKDRQWFKSKVGLKASETPRSISFCTHAILEKKLMVVRDARKDERFKENPMVTGEPHIVFYAGMPLETPSGYNIGTLCVIDHKPRTLTAEQKASLETFSKLVVSYLETSRQNNMVKTLNEAIQKSAEKIQKTTKKIVEESKFASIGEMAGGIAHEINNPLTIISGKAQALMEMIGNDRLDKQKAMQILDKIIKASDRTAKIVQGLENVSGQGEQEPYFTTRLHDVVLAALDVVRGKLDTSGMTVKLLYNKRTEIQCRATKISQCFVNLFLNSIDSLENCKEKWIRIQSHDHEQHLEIHFTDSGHGIKDPRVLANLMQPFYSTKSVGKGMGLGLSVVKGIISAHHGEFYYDTHHKHTQFILKLPKKQKHG